MPFDTRFDRMVRWAQREDPTLTREQAEANTLKYMGRMPACKDHPRVVGGHKTGERHGVITKSCARPR